MSPLYQLQVVFAQNLPHGLAPEGERKFLIDGIVGGKVRIPGIFFVKRFRVFGSKVPIGGADTEQAKVEERSGAVSSFAAK